MGDTSIEWADKSWNPIRRRVTDGSGHFCLKMSPGCDHCYSSTFQPRFGSKSFDPVSDDAIRVARQMVDAGEIFLDDKTLYEPGRWKKSNMVFVCSMTDLFGEWVPDGWIVQMLLVMARTPHTFQILTKRPARMRDFFRRWYDLSGESHGFFGVRGPEAVRAKHPSGRGQLFAAYLESLGEPPPGAVYPSFDWMEGPRWWPTVPFFNIWCGTSIELDRYSWRARTLAETPAAVRFISAEPLLGPLPSLDLTDLHWVIAGSESGPGARPMDDDWVRDLRDRCQAAGVAMFFKQRTVNGRKVGLPELDGRGWAEFPTPERVAVTA